MERLGRSVRLTEAGQVLALEPGIYLPGFGGVRLEEMVVVTPDGAVVMQQWRPES